MIPPFVKNHTPLLGTVPEDDQSSSVGFKMGHFLTKPPARRPVARDTPPICGATSRGSGPHVSHHGVCTANTATTVGHAPSSLDPPAHKSTGQKDLDVVAGGFAVHRAVHPPPAGPPAFPERSHASTLRVKKIDPPFATATTVRGGQHQFNFRNCTTTTLVPGLFLFVQGLYGAVLPVVSIASVWHANGVEWCGPHAFRMAVVLLPLLLAASCFLNWVQWCRSRDLVTPVKVKVKAAPRSKEKGPSWAVRRCRARPSALVPVAVALFGGSTGTGQHGGIAGCWIFVLVRTMSLLIKSTLAKAVLLLRAMAFMAFVACTAFFPAICPDSATTTVGGVCCDQWNSRAGQRRGRGPFVAVRRSRARRRPFALMMVLLVAMLLVGEVVFAFDALPNGDGSGGNGGAGTGLRKVVSDWISGGAAKNTVLATYGPIEDWNVASVTSLKYVFFNKQMFNADLSKWNTAKVTSMYQSTSTLLLCASVPCFFLRILFSHPSPFLRSSS